MYTWPCAKLLAQHVLGMKERLLGKRVLEVRMWAYMYMYGERGRGEGEGEECICVCKQIRYEQEAVIQAREV